MVHTEHAALLWPMEVEKPSGRLMRWRLRLGEFEFDVRYKKGHLNAQADVLSRLRTSGEKEVPVDKGIFCLYLDTETCPHDRCLTNVVEDELEVSDFVLLLTERNAETMIVSITKKKLLLVQRRDLFCATIGSRLSRGDMGSFSYNSERVLFRFASSDERIVVLAPLQQRVLQISHYSKTKGHPDGRRLYCFLRKSFY